MTRDDVFDRYLAAVAAAGAPEHGPIATPEDVQAVAQAVAPLSLPAAVQEAWLRLDYSDWLVDSGGFQSPEMALYSWRLAVDDFGMPRHLFPVSYASHEYLCVELDMPDGPPGGALLYEPMAASLIRHAPSLEWALDFLVRRLERGGIQWEDSWWSGTDDLDGEIRRAAAREPWPDYLQGSVDPNASLTWPAHWQRAAGIDPSGATPLGRTASIGEMLSMSPGDACRVHGKIVGLAAAQAGSHVSVSDGQDEAVVWVPGRADPYSVVRIRDRVELDVTVFEPHPASVLPGIFDEASYRFRVAMARPLPNPSP